MKTMKAVPIYGPDGDVISVTRSIVETPWTVGGTTWNAGQAWLQYLSTPWFRRGMDDYSCADPFALHSWFRAILERKADALAAVPPAMMVGARGDDRPDEIDATYDDWAKMLEQPNPESTWREFISAHICHRRLYGAALWLTTDFDGDPVEITKTKYLYLLNPVAYEPERNKTTGRIVQWVPRTGQKGRKYPAESVHRFRVASPYGNDLLCPPWLAAKLNIEVDLVWEEANLEFGKRGFNLGGWIVGEEWDKNQIEDVRKVMKDRYGGPEHQGEYGILGGGKINIIPNQANQKNMESVERARFNMERLLAIEGIPLSWVSKGAELNNSTLEGEDAGAWIRTINPELTEIETYWWHHCFSKIDKGRRWLQFQREQVPAFHAALMGRKLESGKKLLDLGYPVNLVNRRLLLGMPKVAWGDDAYVNGAMLPLSFIQGAEARATEKAAMEAAALAAGAATSNAAPGDAAGDGSATAAANASANNAPRSEGARAAANDRAKTWDAWVRAVLDPHESAFKKMMVTYFDAQRREVLKNFDEVTGDGRKLERTAAAKRALTTEEIDKILFDIQEWNRKLVTRATPIYRSIVGSATSDVATELGGLSVWSESNPAVTSLLEARGAALVTVNETTIEALRETLVAGSEANETVLELAQRINAVFNEGSRARSQTIARTETAGTANTVRFEAMKAEGIESHYWDTAGDEAVRESHKALKGETRKLGEPFSNGLLEPGDLDGPAEEVVNCFPGYVAVEGSFTRFLKANYAGPVWKIETARGHRLTVTSNHPILTADGWIPAKEIAKGDRLFSDLSNVGFGVKRNIDAENVPAKINDLFDAFASNGRMRPSMVGALDLHGDGERCHGNVNIVDVNVELLNCVEASATQECGDLGLVLANSVYRRAKAASAENLAFARIGGSASRRPGSSKLSRNLGGVISIERPLHGLCGGSPTNLHAICAKDSKENTAAVPDFIRELLQAGSGSIAADKVVDVWQEEFVGHVFDAETRGGWMLANGIVASNCRCRAVAVPIK